MRFAEGMCRSVNIAKPEGVPFGQEWRPALLHLPRAFALYVSLLGQFGSDPAPTPEPADPLKRF